MPKNMKQALALLVVGGLSALAGSIVADVSKMNDGLGGFAAQVGGGAVGAAVGLLVLSGKGAKLA